MKKYITNKRETANISAALVLYRNTHTHNGVCDTQTPMFDCYANKVNTGEFEDNRENREKYLRVARYLGWEVRKSSGNNVFENGVLIWSDTVGH